MDDEEWPFWSANKGASITYDGLPLDDVLTKIHSQIEILKTRPPPEPIIQRDDEEIQQLRSALKLLSGRIEKLEQAKLVQHIPTTDPIPVIVSTTTKGHPPPPKIEEPTPPAQEIDFSGFTADWDKKIQLLTESTARNLKQAETGLKDKIYTLDSKLSDHENRNCAFELKIVAMHEDLKKLLSTELQVLSSSVTAKFDAVDEQLKKILQKVESDHEQTSSFLNKIDGLSARMDSLEIKLSSLADNQYVTDERIKAHEKLISHSSKEIEDINTRLLSIFDECDLRFQSEMKHLDSIKVDRSEMNLKTDMVVTMGKADLSDIDRLDGMLLEISRRLAQQFREAQDAVNTLQKTYDKKIDSIGAWCLQLTRKDQKSGGDNADIGKIKCLVCDQVVKQNVEQDIVFGGPGMKNTMKSLKGLPRPASSAGPRGRGASPPPPIRGANETAPLLSTPQVMSRLAKLTAVVANPGGIAERLDDESLTADEAAAQRQYQSQIIDAVGSPPRAEQDIGVNDTKELGVDISARVQTRNFPSMSLSGGTPLGTTQEREYVTSFRQSANTESQPYFKDLENKFAGSGGKKNVAFRPNSAPMKRAQAGKLQALGRPIDFR